MSGIAGILNTNGAPVDRELLWAMTRHLAPRGPDAQHIWIDGSVGFGHTLLRTTFESEAEKQPCTLDQKTWITADCRVDDRANLICKLAGRGHEPHKNVTDPELILHAYAAWGEKCVEHLLGDFSFALWDSREKRLFCARDHFGVKPFLYSQVGGAFIFSNTLNCLRLHPAVSNTLDEIAIADYLLWGSLLDHNRSSFSDIRRLPPSHTLTVSGGKASLNRYWDLPQEDEIQYRRRADYIGHFLELIEVATLDRLRTDRVAVFMSGGLDSTTVTAMAERQLSASGNPFRLQAHTIVFDRIVPDEERKYSQLVADTLGIPIHHLPLDDYRLPLRELEPERYPPEPCSLLDSGRVIHIHRRPIEDSRVLLRGDAADAVLFYEPKAMESMLRTHQYGRLVSDVAWLSWKRKQIPKLGIRTVLRKKLGHSTSTASLFPTWLNPELERRLDLRSRWQRENETAPIKTGFELMHAYWPQHFESQDPGIMQLAAEARYPFVDLRLVKFLLRLPAVPWAVDKNLLRFAMKGVLPKQVLDRPKAALAGNPWVMMLPPVETPWWEEYLIARPELEEFVDLKAARASLIHLAPTVLSRNEHGDIDAMRLALRPISLSIWLQSTACANLRNAR